MEEAVVKQSAPEGVSLGANDKIVAGVIMALFTAAGVAAFMLSSAFLHGGTDYSSPFVYAVIGAIVVSEAALYRIFYLYQIRLFKEKKLLVLVCLMIFINHLVCDMSRFYSLNAVPFGIAAVVIAYLVERRIAFMCHSVFVLQAMLYLVLAGISDKNVESYVIDSIVPVTVGLLSGAVAIFQFDRNIMRLQFIARLAFVSLITFLFIVIFSSFVRGNEVTEVLAQAGVGALIQIALPFLLVFILEYSFNILTSDYLVSLCDYNRPLLKRLADEAPATFNHSQAVSNFAEACANAIGENVYMARAGAFYHDVGKMENPLYFVENQKGVNPHDSISPELSANMIARHASDGYKLAMKAGIPHEVAVIAREHHGTTSMAFFLEKAKKLTDGEVDANLFKYKEPTPSTKVAAIIMICDSCEAAIRSMGASEPEQVNAIVRGIVNDRLLSGQFDNCPITMRELAIIRHTIVDFSASVHHKRIKYPGQREDNF